MGESVKGKILLAEAINNSDYVVYHQFGVYVTDKQAATYILQSYVIDQLLFLKKQFSMFGLAVCGGEIVIALNSANR